MRRLVERWDAFWFTPTSTAPLALFRMAVGVLTLAWTLTLLPDLLVFHGRSGAFPDLPDRPWYHGVFDVADSDAVLVLGAVLLVIASACLIAGWHSRIASIIVWALVVSFYRHNPNAGNAGERVILALTFFLMLAPSGAALSLDRRRREPGAAWAFPLAAPWALRLAQIQVSVIYLFTVWYKVQEGTWANGTASYYAWNMGDIVRIPVPALVLDNELLINLATWATLAIELAMVVLVWSRRYRLVALGLGLLLHVSIELTMNVGFFGPAMVVSYVAFLPPDVAERLVDRARARWRATVPVSGAPRSAPTGALPGATVAGVPDR